MHDLRTPAGQFDDAPVVHLHVRTIGVEDVRDLDFDAMHALEIEEHRFGAALALVVAGARAHRTHRAAIALALRLDDVVFPEREMTAVVQGGEVAGVATRKIVDRGHAEPVVQQLRAQMAAEEPGSAGPVSPLSSADVRSPLRSIHSGRS
jgi:hypothetical protein